MEVLFEIERLFGILYSGKYSYMFRELHGVEGDDDFEGYVLCVRNKETGYSHWHKYAGFPTSAVKVQQQIDHQLALLREAEAPENATPADEAPLTPGSHEAFEGISESLTTRPHL